ncbi:hypothetical protein FHX72_002945 [Pseudoclavibacter helvolus]|uniref:Uncharacterized protein n=1 Tax=Pseudoclavibacter helvolus TaxID=255205 RepID=A0A7W4URG1_9MICO|nr:hypothetical protein [Pseudoclavibacter helvolus]
MIRLRVSADLHLCRNSSILQDWDNVAPFFSADLEG